MQKTFLAVFTRATERNPRLIVTGFFRLQSARRSLRGTFITIRIPSTGARWQGPQACSKASMISPRLPAMIIPERHLEGIRETRMSGVFSTRVSNCGRNSRCWFMTSAAQASCITWFVISWGRFWKSEAENARGRFFGLSPGPPTQARRAQGLGKAAGAGQGLIMETTGGIDLNHRYEV